MDHALLAVLVAGVLVAAIALFRPRPAVVIEIVDGKLSVTRGKVAARVLSDIEQLCAEYRIQSGTIRVFNGKSPTLLRFSTHIPAAHHQRIRNVWNSHR
jgi:hypothetical protein